MNSLLTIVQHINEYSPEETIYAAEPWRLGSDAIVALETPQGGPPEEVTRLNLKYFLEISIAQDFLKDWLVGTNEFQTDEQICDRLIQYAINDA